MKARDLVEAESPRAALELMRPIRIYIALQGDLFCASHGYPNLPVFSSDPVALQKTYPGAVIVEYVARPVRIVPAHEGA